MVIDCKVTDTTCKKSKRGLKEKNAKQGQKTQNVCPHSGFGNLSDWRLQRHLTVEVVGVFAVWSDGRGDASGRSLRDHSSVTDVNRCNQAKFLVFRRTLHVTRQETQSSTKPGFLFRGPLGLSGWT